MLAVTAAPPTAFGVTARESRQQRKAALIAGQREKASDGFAEAGAALRALQREKRQEEPQQHAVPRQADGHRSPSAGGSPEPQGTVPSGARVCLCVPVCACGRLKLSL